MMLLLVILELRSKNLNDFIYLTEEIKTMIRLGLEN
jgi:hypothetical protein